MTYNCEGLLRVPVLIHGENFPEKGKRFYNKDKTYKYSSNGLMDKSVLRDILTDLEKLVLLLFLYIINYFGYEYTLKYFSLDFIFH